MSTEPYTPTDEQIREAATRFECSQDRASFDRWLATVRAEAKAEGLRGMAEWFEQQGFERDLIAAMACRERADRIEQEARNG